MTGSRVRPSAVRRKSARGGTVASSLGAISPQLSGSLSSLDRIRSLIGGALIGRLAPLLPANATVHAYGFLGGPTPLGVTSLQLMLENLTIERFSHFESPTVEDRHKLAAALSAPSQVIDGPLFRTRIGGEFPCDEIAGAMTYQGPPGGKAVVVA